jgi:hypothetical protein
MTTDPNVDIVIYCRDLRLQFDFWSVALGYRKVGIARLGEG